MGLFTAIRRSFSAAHILRDAVRPVVESLEDRRLFDLADPAADAPGWYKVTLESTILTQAETGWTDSGTASQSPAPTGFGFATSVAEAVRLYGNITGSGTAVTTESPSATLTYPLNTANLNNAGYAWKVQGFRATGPQSNETHLDQYSISLEDTLSNPGMVHDTDYDDAYFPIKVEFKKRAPKGICCTTVPGAADGNTGSSASSVSDGGVQWDGTYFYCTSQLTSDGFGSSMSQSLNWSNIGQVPASGLNGNGINNPLFPFLTQSGANDGSFIANGDADQKWFTPVSGGGYQESFYRQSTFTAGTGEYALKDSTGNETRFYDFGSSTPAAQRGKVKGFKDKAGNDTTYTYDGSNRPDAVTRSVAVGGVTTKEALQYTYVSSGANAGKVATATLGRKIWTTGGTEPSTYTTVRSVAYDYYGSESYGNLGDLKTATTKDASGNAINVEYYRWYKSGDSDTTAHGYTGGLKFVLAGASYDRAGGAAALTASDTSLATYADHYFEYDSSRRVTKHSAQGEGCSTCAGGIGTYTYTYSSNSHNDPDLTVVDENFWRDKMVETLPDGNTNTFYSNEAGQLMLKVFTNTGSGSKWGEFYQYDADGRVTLHAGATTVDLSPGLSTLETYDDLLHVTGGNYAYLVNDKGPVDLYSYGSATSGTISETVAGDVKGYLRTQTLRHGETSTTGEALQVYETYFKRTGDSTTVYPLATASRYSGVTTSESDSSKQTTSYSYAWTGTSRRPTSVTTKLPLISDTKNGPGGTDNDISTVAFDTYGRPTQITDAGGFISTMSYDAATGATLQSVTDTASLNLTTINEVDKLGRTIKMTDANGNVTRTYYDDVNHEIRVYPGWNSTTGTTTGPIQVMREDRARKYTESLTTSATPATSGAAPDLVPAGTETITSGNIQTLTRDYLNDAGQVTYSDRYFSTASLTYSTSPNIGTLNTNYYRTQMDYDGRGRLKRTIEPTGTINWTVYDGLGRMVSQWVGTNDTGFSNSDPSNAGTSPNNMKKIADYVYDGGGIGDSHLTKTTLHPTSSSTADRITEDYYDWRGRVVATKSGVQTVESDTSVQRMITWCLLDNLGEQLECLTFDGDGVTVNRAAEEGGTDSDGIPDQPSASLLRSKSANAFDEQGRVYKSDTFSVDPSAGTIGNRVQSNIFYDHRGNVIKSVTTGGATTKLQYDGAGRATKTFVTDGDGAGGTWSDADDVIGDKVLEQTQTTYDGNGNAILTVNKQRFHDTSGTGDLGGPVTDTTSSGITARSLVGTTGNVIAGKSAFTSGTPTGANMTGYSGGGIALDFTSLPGTPTASEFVFSIGRDNSTSDWVPAPVPASVTKSGNRVTILWSGGIAGKWVRVSVKANATTGLSTPDVSYFGNVPGDTNADGSVSVGDLGVVSTYFGQSVSGGPTQGDFNGDGTVSIGDTGIQSTNFGLTLPLITPATNVPSRNSYSAAYYDSADRLTARADVGTDDGDGVAYARPSSATRSDTVLVNSYGYNAAGWAETTTDPRNIVSKTFYDLLGRTTKTVAAYADDVSSDADDQTTLYAYDGVDHVTALTALLKDGPDSGTAPDQQVTAYTYGVTQAGGNGIDSNDLLKEVAYPNTTTGAAGTTNADKVRYTYNALGDGLTVIDQNGTTHTYNYDVLGRVLSDDVGNGTLPTGVDGTVRKIASSFDSAGRLEKITSTSSSGTVVNQVQEAYNGLGQLTTEYQEHSGSVNTGTSTKVQYAYETANSGGVLSKGSRLVSITYPNLRVLTYNYSGATLDDSISRLTSLSDPSATLESYSYLGLGTIVQRLHPQNGIDLSYLRQGTEATGDAGDRYTGLDRFGRIVDQRWIDRNDPASTGDDTAADRYQYAYDRNSNVLYKNNLLKSGKSELYSATDGVARDSIYDNLNRLTGFQRGDLTASGSMLDTVTTSTRSQSFTLDALGNWGNTTGSSATAVTNESTPQTRKHNTRNQLTEFDADGPGTTLAKTLTYDSNGSMTTDETGKTLVYDAWNRLMADKSGATTVRSYKYDGLGRRIVEAPQTGTATDLYLSANWQVIEEKQGTTVKYQNVWSPSYIDTLIERDTLDSIAAGALDTSFSGDGLYTFSSAGSDDLRAALQSDGKVVVAGYLGDDVALVRFNVDGTLDTNFGTGGMVVTEFDAAANDRVRAITVQDDGKIVIAGSTGGNDVIVARYTVSGAVDTLFDTDGKISFGGAENASGIAIQEDGKVIIVGDSDNNLLVARFNANGTLDTSYSNDGVTNGYEKIDFLGTDRLDQVAIQSDGKAVAAGSTTASSGKVVLARFNTDGTLDTAFDGDGTPGNGSFAVDFGGSADAALALALDDRGRIVIAGNGGVSSDFIAGRFNASNGTLDTTFDSDGKAYVNFGGTDDGEDMMIDSAGRIVIAGSKNSTDFAVARLNTDGSADSTFGTSGQALVSFVGGATNEECSAMMIQPDGKIVLAGNSNNDIAVARISSGGSRIYATQDANNNTTAVVGVNGNVLERYVEDPYGSVTVLNPNWSTDADKFQDVDMPFLHQGFRWDGTSGLYYARNRDYSPTLGRFLSEDSNGYADSLNLYEYVRSGPINRLDPTGLGIFFPGPGPKGPWGAPMGDPIYNDRPLNPESPTRGQ